MTSSKKKFNQYFSKTMKSIKNVLLFVSIILSENAFAAAGFADSFYAHRHWIFPAYAYCLGFGLATLFIFTIISLLFKTKTKRLISAVSRLLKENAICGIIVVGILWGILLGIISAVLYEIFWFIAIIPIIVIMICFPLGLTNSKIRKNFMLSPFMLKLTGMIVMSAVIASVLFIILTNFGVLKGTDVTYLARPSRFFNSPTHPYDSMKEIWGLSIIYMIDILVAIALYLLGCLNRFIYKKFPIFLHKKRNKFIDSNSN